MSEQQRMMSFQLPEQLARELRQLALARDRSVSAELRRAAEVHLLLAGRSDVEVVRAVGRSESRGRGVGRHGPGEGE
jgi:predicted transcriptional regulator